MCNRPPPESQRIKRNLLRTLWDTLTLILSILVFCVESLLTLFITQRPKSLAGEVILITGAGSGIGREICIELGSSGAKIVCWDINQDCNAAIVKELKSMGACAYSYVLDVSDRAQVEVAANKVKKEVGEVTILINNAGIAPCQEFLKYSPKSVEKVFEVNVLSGFWTLREFLPKMIERSKGHVVTMCSICGLKGNRYMVPYHGSKAAIHGYIESLKMEMRHHKQKPDIKFTTVYPFVVNTRLINGIKVELRFPMLTPILKAKEVAKTVVDGIKIDKEYIYCPAVIPFFLFLENFLPNKAKSALMDYLMCTFEPTNID